MCRVKSLHIRVLTMKLYKYTVSELKEAVRTSYTIRQTLQKLGVAAYGGNYAVFKKAILHYDIDTSHFRRSNKGIKLSKKRSIEEYLSNKASISSYKLKRRLIEEGILQPLCSRCKLTSWLDEDIPLELHHKDGNSKNNNLTNLSLLCPNCHALTDNYRGKNISSP